MKVLVVGAGFAGATVARELAEAGHTVLVIDRRDHVAGNAFDYVNEHGIRVHRYGPHLWHTSNDDVQEWASRFTEWEPYHHWVLALLKDGITVPLPINHDTVEEVLDIQFEEWLEDHPQWYAERHNDIGGFGARRGAHSAFLETLVTHHDPVTNSRQHVENSVGKELCDLLFAPYTKKMWGLELEELPASVAARIPTNVESGSWHYFPKDKHQYLPKDGYTAMVSRILDHPNITVRLELSRQLLVQPGADIEAWLCARCGIKDRVFDHVFTSEPIDTYFNCELGELPWRSIKMHTFSLPVPTFQGAPVVNFTHDGPHTRVTEWKNLPVHGDNPYWTTLTVEEPCDYKDNDLERYYPVKTSLPDCPHRALYQRYKEKAEALHHVTFIGRCGTYQYLDMWIVIAQSLKIARDWLNLKSVST